MNNTDKQKIVAVKAFGLITRVFDFSENSGYGCSECCNGDRCEDDCTATYRRRDKNCPHCRAKCRIPRVAVEETFTEYPVPSEHLSQEKKELGSNWIPVEVAKVKMYSEDCEWVNMIFNSCQFVPDQLINDELVKFLKENFTIQRKQ